MNILISKDGEQIGPCTIEEARDLVLSGRVNAADPAQCEGDTGWKPLNQIPGFAIHPGTPAIQMVNTPPVSVGTGSPVTMVTPLHEEDIWKGSPSQLLNLRLYVSWFCFFVAAVVLVYFGTAFVPQIPKLYAWLAVAALVPVCALQCMFRALKLRSTRYEITNQRVRVVRGLLGKDVQEIELFRVKDTSANQTLFLRLFGLGNMRIVSGDVTNPEIFLHAIPNAIDLREKLRHEVLALRQKLGVREMDVMQGS